MRNPDPDGSGERQGQAAPLTLTYTKMGHLEAPVTITSTQFLEIRPLKSNGLFTLNLTNGQSEFKDCTTAEVAEAFKQALDWIYDHGAKVSQGAERGEQATRPRHIDNGPDFPRASRTATDDASGTINDGFGSEWDIVCEKCGKATMQVVRPGLARCGDCDE